MEKRRPMEIDWKELDPSIKEDTSIECEIWKTNRFGGDPDQKDCNPELLTDQQLDDKISRGRSLISLTLRDGGMKLRMRLKALEDEKDRRRSSLKESASFQRSAQMALSRRNDSLLGSASSVCASSSSSCSSSSVFGISLGPPEKPAYYAGSSGLPFREEISCLNSAKPKGSTESFCARKQSGRDRLRLLVQGSVSGAPKRALIPQPEKKDAIMVDNDFPSAGHLSSSLKQSSSVDMHESRQRSLRIQNSRDLTKQKIETVILLDEDDGQPMNKMDIEKDEHGWIEAKIYYPSRDHAECVEICSSDMKCLEPCSYLSSPIMNFYIQYLQKVQTETGRARTDYQFFNTYFYNKLEEALAYKGPQEDDSFMKLRRWWKGINMFQKSYIFLPIHSDEHWSLVIICIPAMEDEHGPIIIHLDSLGLHNSNLIFFNVERYLEKEWEHLKDELSLPDFSFSYKVWRQLPSKTKSRKIEVPQQDNPYDCGLFVLYFIQRFIEDAPERVRMKDLCMFGRKWFKPEEASRLRQHLKRLLQYEFEGARLLDNERPCTVETN